MPTHVIPLSPGPVLGRDYTQNMDKNDKSGIKRARDSDNDHPNEKAYPTSDYVAKAQVVGKLTGHPFGQRTRKMKKFQKDG